MSAATQRRLCVPSVTTDTPTATRLQVKRRIRELDSLAAEALDESTRRERQIMIISSCVSRAVDDLVSITQVRLDGCLPEPPMAGMWSDCRVGPPFLRTPSCCDSPCLLVTGLCCLS